MQVRERFSPKPLGVNVTREIPGLYLGGFLAKTSGTISVIAKDTLGTGTVTVVDAVPVTAGFYTPLPTVLEAAGYSVVLAGGASGTLFV